MVSHPGPLTGTGPNGAPESESIYATYFSFGQKNIARLECRFVGLVDGQQNYLQTYLIGT